MALVTLPYDLTNGAPADADQVMANLDAVVAVLNGNVDKSNTSETILGLVAGLGDLKVNFGQLASFDWNAGANFTVVTGIAHGFSSAPSFLVALNGGYNGMGTPSSTDPWVVAAGNVGATTFDVVIGTRNAATLGAFTVGAGLRPYWLAIGPA